MGSVLSGPCYGICVVWSVLWDLCCLVRVVGSVLSSPCYGVCVVWSVLWGLCCLVRVVGSVLSSLCCLVRVMGSEVRVVWSVLTEKVAVSDLAYRARHNLLHVPPVLTCLVFT